MKVFYNDIDKFCCGVLRKNINAGNLYAGDVSDKNIREIHGRDLAEYRQIHLFAGIGGFPLGLRWAGMPDDFSILTGGFPCQPFSHAGRRKGAADNRYLWPEMLRVISEVKPAYVLAENVRGFISLESGRYLDKTYADLEREGYEILPPFILPASAFGAPHKRDRIWIIAYNKAKPPRPHPDGAGLYRTQPNSARQSGEIQSADQQSNEFGPMGKFIPDSSSPRLHARSLSGIYSGETGAGSWDEKSERLCTFSGHVCDSALQLPHRGGETRNRRFESTNPDWWEVEPAVGRVADGIPGRVDSLKSLGNAIVPQIAAYIGGRILEFDRLAGGTINAQTNS